jgi:hypothetical protein
MAMIALRGIGDASMVPTVSEAIQLPASLIPDQIAAQQQQAAQQAQINFGTSRTQCNACQRNYLLLSVAVGGLVAANAKGAWALLSIPAFAATYVLTPWCPTCDHGM